MRDLEGPVRDETIPRESSFRCTFSCVVECSADPMGGMVDLRPCSVILDSFRAGNNRYYKKHTVGTTKYWDLFRAGNYFVAISSQPEINSGLLLYLLFLVLNESHITE